MTTYYRTVISEVGPEVGDLIEGGILILFAEGAPPELAEVSVLHAVVEGPTPGEPPVGAELSVGPLKASLTAVGSLAWSKIAEMGHVVINFDGATRSARPGELSASPIERATLAGALKPGVTISIAG